MIRYGPPLALALAVGTCFGAGAHSVSIELSARSFRPGEPVRVQMRSTEPLAVIEGEFLGRTVFLTRVPAGATDGLEHWEGWTIIGLDQEPGPAVLEAQGQTRDGTPAVGTRAVRIEAHAFPEEALAVAPKFVEPPPEVQARLARERSKLRALYETRTPEPPPSAPFVRPVPGEPTSVFGTRRVFNGKPRDPHPGLDLRAASGTPVHGSGAGRVVLAQELYYAGNTVILDHGGGLFTLYAHLSELLVDEGEPVAAGQLIGRSGTTGRVTGPHLHWGAKIGDLPFDPTALLDDGLFPAGEVDGSPQ